MPPWRTAPMYTSSTSEGSTLQLARAALAATVPRWGALRPESEPMKEPIGVLLQPTMTVDENIFLVIADAPNMLFWLF